MNKLSKVKSVAGYTTFFLVVFVGSLIATFPYGALKTTVNLSSRSPVKFGKLGYSFPLGIRGENLHFSSPDGASLFDVTYATAKLGLLSLVTFSPKLNIELRFPLGNVIRGTVGKLTSPKKEFSITARRFDLAKFEGLASLGVTASGIVDLTGFATASVDSVGASSLHATIRNLTLAKLPLGAFTISNVSFGTADIKAEFAGKKLKFIHLTTDGDFASDLSGTVIIGSTKNDSAVELRGRIKLGGKLATSYGPFINAALGAPDASGFQKITIVGPIGNPTVKN